MLKNTLLAAFGLLLAAVSLGACANPTIDAARAGIPDGPYDNTANSLGGRYVGGGD